MRNWINLFERVSDGCWLNPSPAEVMALVAKGDMRGVAVGKDIWMDYAAHDTHYGMRGRLALPPHSFEAGGDPQDGFDFYVCASGTFHEFDQDDDEHVEDDFQNNNNGRQDWIMGSPQFEHNGLAIMMNCEKSVALQNRGFARMVAQK
jgi:hypothetical protein